MYIFLDESKNLTKKGGKFILAGLATKLKPGTIDFLYQKFLKDYNLKEVGGEIKSFDKKYRNKISDFYIYLKNTKYGKDIEFVGVFAKNYFENGENYYHCLELLVKHTIEFNKLDKNPKIINIIADNIKLNYYEKDIQVLLNKSSRLKKYKIYKGFSFWFGNSKKYGGIKFADFIAGKLNNIYISEKEKIGNDFQEYFINEEILFIKLK